ncbi:hypothetical protein AJ80_07236 [Polytolypa hystricis UAMH7299]|uniref:Uncharacterized protein n=1 Tax=Polytolypa hystricis (strain UAMH7299) TaxID=1447883 RepID=A0A2B7XR42_POLH7|nr:hypothetical protein AJ80_07236 [Polytolypa hystricis UAMH7299]
MNSSLAKNPADELSHASSAWETQNLIANEQIRGLRIRILLAEHDNSTLRSHIEGANVHLDQLERLVLATESQLLQSQNDSSITGIELRSATRELHDLQSRVTSFQLASADSNKLLAEKLQLTREISTLKAEMKQLASREPSYQSIISEKLGLERQLSSLEVELQSEKRASERARLKSTQQSEETATFSVQLDKMKKELSKERKERETAEEKAKTEAKEWERLRNDLEQQLRTIGTHPQTMVSSVEKPTRRSDRQGTGPQGLARGEKEPHESRKRDISAFKSDMIIATPGAINLAKSKKLSTVPGIKSNFSTTPFLNRNSAAALTSDDTSSAGEEECLPPARGRVNPTLSGASPYHDRRALTRRSYDNPPEPADVSPTWKPTPQFDSRDGDTRKDQPTMRPNLNIEPERGPTQRRAKRRQILLGRQPERSLFKNG